MDRWALWIAGALFSVVLALIWRLYDIQEERERWATLQVQQIRADIAETRLEVLREMSEADRERARLEQRQRLDEDRWNRTIKRSSDPLQ